MLSTFRECSDRHLVEPLAPAIRLRNAYFEQLRIVTFGAVTDLPPKVTNVHQFLGSFDWFGAMNSRLDVRHTKVPDA